MLPTLAGIDAFCARLAEPPEDDADLARAQAALEDSSALIRTEAGTAWVTDDGELDDVPDTIVTLTIAVARRAYLNPDGIRQETLGDHSITYGGTGAVYLTADEKALIRKVVSKPRGLWAMPLTRSAGVETGTVFVDVAGSDEPLPVAPPWPT